MSNATLDATLNANPSGFIKGMREAETSLEKFVIAAEGVGKGAQVVGGAIDGMAQKVKTTGKVFLGLSAGMTFSLGLAIKSATGFQAEMLNVQSIMQGTGSELTNVSKAVVGLSRELPTSANTLAQGLYDVASSGFAGSEGLIVLDASAVSAAAGLTDTAVAAKAITAVLNAYGKSAGAATDVSDILFETVNLGVITFEELAGSVGEWVSIAAAAGVAADDAAAAIAAMTLSGINSAEAATALSRLIEGFVSPSEELNAIAQEMGFASAGMMLDVMGLEQTMQALRLETGGTADAFITLFPNIRAAKGALALAAADGKNYADVASRITDETERAGAASEAYAIQSQGLGMQLQILRNNISAFSLEIGERFVGKLTFVTERINDVTDAVNALPAGLKTLISWLAAGAAAIGAFTGFVLLWGAKAVVWQGIMKLLSMQLANFATILTGMKFGVAAKGFMALSRGAATAGKHMGPLGATMHGVRAAMAGLRNMGLGFVATFAKVTGGVVAAGVAFLTWRNALNKAKRDAFDAGKAFQEAFDSADPQSLIDGIEKARERVRSIADDESIFEMINPLDFTGEQISEETKGLNQSIEQMEQNLDRLRNAAASVAVEGLGLLETKLKDVSDLYRDEFEAGLSGEGLQMQAYFFEEAADGVDGLNDSVIDYMLNLAQSEGLDLAPLVDPDATRKEIEQLITAWLGLVETQESSDAAAVAAADAWAALDEEFATITDRISALDDVFSTLFGTEFGLEEATDNVQSSINDIFQSVEDMKSAGTFSEAMNLRSFHEDALALREDMRGLTSDVLDQTIAWAEQQDSVTGSDIQAYLGDQARNFREVGEALGFSNEFIDHYASMIEDLANSPELVTRFNSNVDEQETKVREYLATVGLADDQIETYLSLRDNQSQEKADTYLETLGLIDNFDPEVYVKAKAEDAKAAIDDLIAKNQSLSEEDYVAIVDLVINGSDDLDAALDELGIASNEWEALVDVIGIETEDEAIALLNTSLEELDTAEAVPEVLLETSQFDTKYNEIMAKLRALRVQAIISFGTAGNGDNRGGGWGAATAEVTDRAMGGVTRNPMVTNRPILWGEAGPEAYIPLGADKRDQAMRLWAEVGQMFGVRGMASGGYSRNPISVPSDYGSRFRPDTGDSSSSSGSGGGGSSSGSGKSGNLDFDTLFSILQNMYELGDLTPAEYDQMLNDILATQKRYSQNYMTVWNEIISVDDEVLRQKEDWVQMIMDINSRMFEVGDLSEDDYLAFLRKRMSETVKYSQEWMEVWSEIESIEEDRKKREEEALAEEQRIQAAKHEVGVLSNKEYLKILRDRLAGLEKFSEEWMETWREIQGIEEEVLQDTKDKNTSNRFSDISGSGFLSTSQVLGYYERMARQAQEWLTIVNGLATAGVSGTIIQDLLSAGPSSLPLAKALRRIYESGQMGALSSSLNTISAIDSFVEKKIGVHTSGPLVPKGDKVGGITFTGDMYFTGPQTVKQFSNEVDFQLGMN